jgi:molybdenum cofactor cytidylyltransferase
MNDTIAGVVLAAGLSSRMGKNKLFLELDGEIVVRRAVKTASAAGLDPVIVVTGNEAEKVNAAVNDLRCTTAYNPIFERGMNTSLQTGIFALPESVAGAVVMLADMPFVTSEMVRELVAKWREDPKPLAISLYGEVFAPPTLYSKPLFQEILTLDEKSCGKRVVKTHRHDALELHWPASALADLDVPEDLERVRAQLAGT